MGMVFVCVLMNGIKKKRLEQDLATLRETNDVNPDQIEINMDDEQNQY